MVGTFDIKVLKPLLLPTTNNTLLTLLKVTYSVHKVKFVFFPYNVNTLSGKNKLLLTTNMYM